MDYKIQNDYVNGIHVKGDPKDIGSRISTWLRQHANGRSEYLSLADKVLDYFYQLKTLLMNSNSRPARLEII